jgi:hypothetical protein
VRRLLPLLLAALLLPVAPAARAAGSPMTVLEMVRVGRGGPSTVTVRLDAVSDASRGKWASLVVIAPKDGRWRWLGAATIFGGYGDAVRTHGTGVSALDGCLGPAPCDDAADRFGDSFEVTLQPGARYLVAGDAGHFTVSVDAAQWTFRRTRIGARRVVAAEGDATIARAGGYSVERFRSASARGGRYGSYVHADLPCLLAGHGDAVLSGGAWPMPMSCTAMSPGVAFTETDRATTWRLAGDVTGLTTMPNRLFVLDYPPL